jgi:hypothetical protein
MYIYIAVHILYSVCVLLRNELHLQLGIHMTCNSAIAMCSAYIFIEVQPNVRELCLFTPYM